jgi:hypothetical protein
MTALKALRLLALGLASWLLAGPVRADPAAVEETIGSWVLACPPAHTAAHPEPCILRHRTWILQPGNGGPSAALEVQMRNSALVPVVTLRNLPLQAALGGALVLKPTVAIRFDNGPGLDMNCGLSGADYACAPTVAAIPQAARVLPTAHSVTVRVELTIPGLLALPPAERAMDLAGTEPALARLRAVGAISETLPVIPGLDLQEFLDRVLRAAGFENGAADLVQKLVPAVSGGKG